MIKEMQDAGLSPDQMLRVIKIARVQLAELQDNSKLPTSNSKLN